MKVNCILFLHVGQLVGSCVAVPGLRRARAVEPPVLASLCWNKYQLAFLAMGRYLDDNNNRNHNPARLHLHLHLLTSDRPTAGRCDGCDALISPSS